MEISLMAIADEIPDEDAAYRLLEEIRWPDGPVCPHCGETEKVYFLTPKDDGRKTRTGTITRRRLWKCGRKGCRKQFSVLVGTVFEGTKVPIRKWLFAIHMMSAAKNGISAHEIQRQLGVTIKTAWFMLHRIREAMTQDPLRGMLSGTVQADETFVGGKPRNMHAKARKEAWRNGYPQKVPVFTLITEDEARSRVIPNVHGATLANAIKAEVDSTATLHTDGYAGYRDIGSQLAEHEWVDHSGGEYVRGPVSTNRAEGFFSQFKRSVDGTHHAISQEHLHRYVTEFDFRYSTRKLTDSQRSKRIIRQAEGKRLLYREPA